MWSWSDLKGLPAKLYSDRLVRLAMDEAIQKSLVFHIQLHKALSLSTQHHPFQFARSEKHILIISASLIGINSLNSHV